MTLSEPEIKDIKQSRIYVAGFIEEEVRDREELYDIFVDSMYCMLLSDYLVNNRSISVASHAKGDFLMTIVHKDIADFVTSKVEDPESADGDIIKVLYRSITSNSSGYHNEDQRTSGKNRATENRA